MLYFSENEFAVKHWLIAIALALVCPLIPNVVESWYLNLLSKEGWFFCWLFPLY